MIKKLMLPLLVLLSAAASAQPYKGRVYEDVNGNGSFDKADRPLKDVKVSDGLNVVKTAADGTFSLPGHADPRFVFVTVPSGYYSVRPWSPVDGKTQYDFPMSKRKENKAAKFIQLADTETSDGRKWVDVIRRYAANEKADFIIHTGDICYEPGIRFHADSVNTSTMGVPVYYVMGNHDLMKKVAKPEYLYEECLGPAWYSFEASGVHFIVVPMLIGDGRPTYTAEQIYAWLKNDLAQTAPGQRIVVFTHYENTLSGNELVFKSKDGKIDFNDYNIRAALIGHWHINYRQNTPAGVPYIVTSPANKGGVDHSPSAFRVVEVDEKGGVSSKGVYSYASMNLALVSPSSQVYSPGSVYISANAYNATAHVEKVAYTVLKGRKVISKGTLERVTDWNYARNVKLKTVRGDQYTVEVTAFTSDGQTKKVSRNFTVSSESIVPEKIQGPWAQLRGNEMHNQAGVTNGREVKYPRLAWVANAGGNIFMASPIVADGTVFTATVDNDMDGRSAVVALDARTGAEKWRYSTANSVKNTIVYSSGKVFAVDAEGTVYALDADTGGLVWKKKLEVGYLPAICEGLVVRGDTLYAGAGRGLSALNASDGSRFWKNEDFGQACGTVTTMTLAGNTLISSAHWDALYGTNIKTGKMAWRQGASGLRYRDGGTSVYDGKMYVCSSRRVYEMSPGNGDFMHVRNTEHIMQVASTPLLTDGLLISGSFDGLLAFRNDNFDLAWKAEVGPAIFCTAPYSGYGTRSVEASAVDAGNAVLFGASDGIFRAVDKKDGHVIWSYDFACPILTTPAVVDGMIYVADFAGNVYAFAI